MSRRSRPAAFSAFFCSATVERRRAKCHPQHHGIRWNVWLEKEHLLPGAVWTWTAGISCFVCKTDGRHEVNPEILACRANTCWLKGCNQAILTLRRHFCIHNICGLEGCVCTYVFHQSEMEKYLSPICMELGTFKSSLLHWTLQGLHKNNKMLRRSQNSEVHH